MRLQKPNVIGLISAYFLTWRYTRNFFRILKNLLAHYCCIIINVIYSIKATLILQFKNGRKPKLFSNLTKVIEQISLRIFIKS